ncbi:MAG: acyl-CoA dehydrogenase family protein [Planctomycetes bacterium]|nr:acyl-CoA dehydrogenase family protein [Planctomycetota bacterium]
MDFTFSAGALELRNKVARFVESEVIPLEPRDGRPLVTGALRALREKSRSQGLWAPQLPRELGGQGLELPDVCPVFEAAGRSLLGPVALGCAAPDEGNAHLLLLAAGETQRERYLKPLARGDIRSAFAMTEPAPGAGSDPTMMRTRARREGGAWVIDGKKWFATGAAGAAFVIVAAVTEPGAGPKGAMTLFIVDAGTPGLRVTREVPILGGGTPGGHCEIEIEGCRVGDEQVLGRVGEGYALMQARLGPARLTHCMRWIGAAERALEIAARRAREREAFGRPLAEHQAVAWMLADSAIDLHASRLMVHEAAWRLSRGEKARLETSLCKVFVAEAVNRVIDRAIQVCGALGITDQLPLAHFFQEARAFRIYDGPSEVHRMVIARKVLKGS